MPKAKQEEEAPNVCVCGKLPITVKCRNGLMLSCPDTKRCTVRSRWMRPKQAAIHDWNAAVLAARLERRSS